MMMSDKDRLIYANEVIEEIDEIIENINFSSPYQNDNHLIVEGLERARDCVLDACTVDAVKVMYGRWITEDYTTYCSVCHESAAGYNMFICDGEKWCPMWNFNYCPNCGAKMEEV